jgi:hypothetical protein
MKMKETQELLNNYREGNENLRLHLYLDHRDLRPEFMEIEREVFLEKKRIPALGRIRGKIRCCRLHTSCLKAFRVSHGGA